MPEDKSLLTKDDYQYALDSQTACNTSGLVVAFARAMHRICNEDAVKNKGTEWKNKHPIVILYLTQLAHLSGETLMHPKYYEAHEACEKGAQGQDWE
jgi:hypothetical protein